MSKMNGQAKGQASKASSGQKTERHLHVVVVGQPGLVTKEEVFNTLSEAPFANRIHTVVAIDMNGANVFSQLWAESHGHIEIRSVRANDMVKRNTILAENVDVLIAWWDNKSAEINDLMARFELMEKPLIVFQKT